MGGKHLSVWTHKNEHSVSPRICTAMPPALTYRGDPAQSPAPAHNPTSALAAGWWEGKYYTTICTDYTGSNNLQYNK